jgi:hypothetical protein
MKRSSLKSSRIMVSLASLVVAVAAVSFAAGPTTAPTTNPAAARGRGRGAVPPADLTPPVTPVEWDELLKFMDTYSPNMVQDIRDTNLGMTSPSGLNLLREYRSYKMVRDNNFPEVAKLREDRFKIEDDIYDLVKKARQNPAQHPNIQGEIHDEAGLLVQNIMDERAARIKKLSDLLTSEQKQFDTDKANQDKQIDQRAAQIFQGLGPAFRNRQTTRPGAKERLNIPATRPTTVPAATSVKIGGRPSVNALDPADPFLNQVDPHDADNALAMIGQTTDAASPETQVGNDASNGLVSDMKLVFAIVQAADSYASPAIDGE